MAAYTGFARFYDRIMGDRDEEIDRVRGYIRSHRPDAASLLELGCGTGALLAGLADGLDVTGIDQSPQMLAVAAAAVPGARLELADMTAFWLPPDRTEPGPAGRQPGRPDRTALGPAGRQPGQSARFDVVICMFDTLNHVPSFDGWLSLFDRVHEHLLPGGLFIFDVNTAGRLSRLHGGPPYLDEFDGNVVIMTVRPAGGPLSLWETRIFEHCGGSNYRLHHEQIHELGVPLGQIAAALSGRFELLAADSLDGSAVSDESDRAFFCYRRSA